jgi:hypothetical protein
MSLSTMKAGLPTDTGMGGSIVNVVPTVAAGTFASAVEANEKRLNRTIPALYNTEKWIDLHGMGTSGCFL